MDGTYEDVVSRGISHGWDAANYAEAYGQTETAHEEATRRGDGDTRYVDGFMEGWERYANNQWQDGTPRGED